MEYVEPIRDVKKIKSIKTLLKARSERDHLMFVLGINSGLRVSDILDMKIKDVINKDGTFKKSHSLVEIKTGKSKTYPYADNVVQAIKDYIESLEDYKLSDYLFKSRQGSNSPISRQQAWRMLNDVATQVGISDNIGTHTLRKTFGYHAYRAGTRIALLQQLFNHSAPSMTLRYIGITQDEMDDVVLKLNL